MQIETNRIEYKQELTNDIEQTVSAFLNAEGGDIYFGIKKDGSICGVDKPDEIQLKIADRLKDNIRPSIMGLFNIYTQKHNGMTTVVVNLASGAEKQYYIKQKGLSESGCFIRVGSSSQPMTEAMIAKLLAKRHAVSLANIPSRHQNLTFTQLKLYYGLKNKNLNDNFTQSLDFLTPDGQYNLVAFLFADNNNISVRIGKYAGTNKLDLIGREDFKDCCLITAMQKVLDRFDVENITQSRKRPMHTRLDKKLVDKDVLHEVIINAFAHNDYSKLDPPIFDIYSDRFLITSFGGLVVGLDVEKFFSGVSKPRNREIMRVLKDLEFVEQLGSGIPEIVEKYGRKAIDLDGGLMQTTLAFDGNMGERVSPIKTVEKSREKSEEKTAEKSVEKIINLVKENATITTKELAATLQISASAVEKHLKKLTTNGKLRRIGPDKGGHWEVIENNIR